MVDHDLIAEREVPRIRNHGSEKLHALLIRRDHIARGHAIVSSENRIHAAVWRVTDISLGLIPELIVPSSIRQALANVGLQRPCAEHRAIRRGFAALY